MKTLYDVLLERHEELIGTRAESQMIKRLVEFGADRIPGLIQTFRDLPICGMIVAFSIDQSGRASLPVTLDTDDYDSDHDHAFYWMRPNDIVEDLTISAAGPVIRAAGYIPIGMCVFGGDFYYLKPDRVSRKTTLCRLYRDWIDSRDAVPLPGEAIGPVSESFQDVLRVADFRRGL